MTKNITFIIAMFIMFISGHSIAQQPSPVKVQDGLLQGTFEDRLEVYKGIPFAAPPVGDLRWRAPQPVAKWEGVREAINFAEDLIKAYTVGSNTVPKTARDLARDAAFGWYTWSWARLQSDTTHGSGTKRRIT